MIAPRDRLLLVAVLTLPPLAALAALGALSAEAALVLAGLPLLAAALDLLRSQNILEGAKATVPEVTRLTKDKKGALEVVLDPAGIRLGRVRLAILFPPELEPEFEEIETDLPGGGEKALVQWPLRAAERGNFHIERLYLEARSPFGLWSVRSRLPLAGEVRVYPNTLRERRNLAALFLNRGALGVHTQRQVGKGKEFEKLRDYVPGDSYEDIHWKATARRSYPVTKVYQIERTQEIYVVMDSSRLSGRKVILPPESIGDFDEKGGGEIGKEQTQLERFITAAMVLGLVAEKQGDHFGVMAFDERARSFVRAKNGKAHYGACRDAIYALEPALVNPDFGETFSFLRTRLRRRALLIFLTNLDDPVAAESFLSNIGLLSRRHLVLVNMIVAPGVAPLFSAPDAAGEDDVYRRVSGHLLWQNLAELSRSLKHRGVAMNMLDNEKMCLELVSQYINVKRRQLL